MPDDCEIRAGGVATLWAAQGHHVKFVSVTNGDIGHWREAGGPLARRRTAEVEQAAKILGITTEVLDNHDGELLPTLENRRSITRLIREWKADIVMSHRPNDYHPDHRYSGILVQDAAYMVTVPFFCPDTPILTNNPIFLFYPDSFQKPNPFQPDIIVDIGSVIEKKLNALGTLESQFYEGGAERIGRPDSNGPGQAAGTPRADSRRLCSPQQGHCGSLSHHSGLLVRQRECGEGEVCGGVRGVRVWPATEQNRVDAAFPLLRGTAPLKRESRPGKTELQPKWSEPEA